MDVKRYKCRFCHCIFQSLKDLFYHKNIQHGGSELQNEPWLERNAPPPWSEAGHNFHDLYRGNRAVILAPRRKIGKLKEQYNFPTDNLRKGADEISNAITSIFNDIFNLPKKNFKNMLNLKKIILQKRVRRKHRKYHQWS